MKTATVYLALGANLGNRKLNLKQAIELLSEKVDIDRVSPIYETDPVGYTEQPLFLNLVLGGSTGMKPKELLKFCKDIESKLGRIPSFQSAPRPIDIDILFYDNEVVKSPELVIPHPRLTTRAFVLVPLNEIAPELLHPANGRAIKHLVKDLGDITELHRWGEAEEIWEKK